MSFKKNKTLLFGLCACVYSDNCINSKVYVEPMENRYTQERRWQREEDQHLFSRLKNLKWNTDREQILEIIGSVIRSIVFRSHDVLSGRRKFSVYLRFKGLLECKLGSFDQVSENKKSAKKARLTCAFLFMRLAICTDTLIKAFYKDLLIQMFNENVFLYDAPSYHTDLSVLLTLPVQECEAFYKRLIPE